MFIHLDVVVFAILCCFENNHSTDQFKLLSFFPFSLYLLWQTNNRLTLTTEWIVQSKSLLDRYKPKNTCWRQSILIFLHLEIWDIIIGRWSLLTSKNNQLNFDFWTSQHNWTRWICLWNIHDHWKRSERLQLLFRQIGTFWHSLLPFPCLKMLETLKLMNLLSFIYLENIAK